MMKDKLKRLLGGKVDDTDNGVGEDEFYTTSKEEFHEQNGIAGSKMMLLEPRAYSESQQIADYLKNRCAVVVNLKRVTPDQAKRIVDFLYGTIYAIKGDIQKLGGGIFLCTPNNFCSFYSHLFFVITRTVGINLSFTIQGFSSHSFSQPCS